MHATAKQNLLRRLRHVVDLPQTASRARGRVALIRLGARIALVMAMTAAAGHAAGQTAFRAIDPTQADKTVTLTGHDLTFDQVAAIARTGEKVELPSDVLGHQQDAYRLLLEGAAEGLAITGFNRAADGTTPLFEGDPAAPETAQAIAQRQLAAFASGAASAGDAGIADEETVRATMAVRANTLPYSPASPAVTEMLIAFLNDRIAPVAVPGGVLKATAAAMVGKGDVYYRGIRMTAAQALADAGLTPLVPAGMDDQALVDSAAESVASAAIVAADGARALDWADVTLAMELVGANANIAALSLPAQADRPFQWLNWDAFRVLAMLKGSYLLADDPGRPPTMPERLRALPGHQGAAWMEWGQLRNVVLVALNASDQAIAVRVDLSPRESSELGSAQMKRFAVRGSRANGSHRGYIVETANADPSPVLVATAGFAFALENLDAALATQAGRKPPEPAGAPDMRAKTAIDGAFHLLGGALVAAAATIDQRLAESQDREMGDVTNSVLTEFRKIVPAGAARDSAEAAAYDFLMHHPVSEFYDNGEAAPGSDDPIPLAQERLKR
jgi:histidine ammonia-lyase